MTTRQYNIASKKRACKVSRDRVLAVGLMLTVVSLSAAAQLNVDIGTLPPGKTLTIVFDTAVSNPLSPAASQASNQGSVSGSNFATVPTDDPDTPASADATVTPLMTDTTTTVASSGSPSTFGEDVTFTATVAPEAGGVSGIPTGTVTFMEGPTLLGAAPLNGTGQATLVLSDLSVGTHTNITANYAGEDDWKASVSTGITHTVEAGDSTTTLASDANPSAPGQLVTFTATVVSNVPGVGPPTGTVEFFDGAASLGTETLVNGVATLATDTLAVGDHVITATYGGDTEFNTSTSAPLTQTVGQTPEVTVHPVDQSSCAPADITFTAAATGDPTPTVQWQVDSGGGFTDIPGATMDTLTLIAATTDQDGYQYRAVYTNAIGTAATNPATLSVIDVPEIPDLKFWIVFGPELTSEFISASDGTWAGRVHVTWSLVPGATEYQLHRARKSDLSDATPITDWIDVNFFDDEDVNTLPVFGFECRRRVVSTHYYYYVIGRNICGEGNPSNPDSGFARIERIFCQWVLPGSQTKDGAQVVTPESILMVRVRSDEPIALNSVSGIIRAESPLDEIGVGIIPVVEGDDSDLWVTYTPVLAPWLVDDTITFTVAARTVSGRLIEPVTHEFTVIDGIQQAAESLLIPVAQPGYGDLTDESGGMATVSAGSVVGDLPPLDVGVGDVFTLGPDQAFDTPQRVWLPIPAGASQDGLTVYYYYQDGPASDWVPGQLMEGWLVPDSEMILEFEGVVHYGLLVHHGAVVQLGYDGYSAETLSPAGVLGPNANDLGALLELMILLGLVYGIQRYTGRWRRNTVQR